MVYKIFSDGIESERSGKRNLNPKTKLAKAPQLHIRAESFLAIALVRLIKIVLFIYDCISLPIYFILQRPDRRAKEAQRTRSERVDINTWIKTDQNPNETGHLLHGSKPQTVQDFRNAFKKSHRFMGSTLNEIFSNALAEYGPRPCLGYRAVVTCPVMTQNGQGQPIMEDKSFRSDFTWYTYEQVGRRVQDLASGLYYHSVLPELKVLFFANTNLEWFCVSQACFQLTAKIVTCPEISDIETLKSILVEAEVSIIFTSCDRLKLLSELFNSMQRDQNKERYRIKKIVLIDWLFPIDYTEPAFVILRNSAKDFIDELISIGQVEEAGVENPIELSCTKFLNKVEAYGKDDLEQDEMIQTRNVSDETKAQFRSRSNSIGVLNQNNSKDLVNEVKKKISLAYQPSNKFILNEEKSALDSLQTSSWSLQAQKRINGPNVKPADLAMIVYTHGSLGQLKAVMLSHCCFAQITRLLFLNGMIHENPKTLSLDSVILDMINVMCVFNHGGSIGYSGLQTLFYDSKELNKRDRSDLEALDPTFLLVRPYILERLRVSTQKYLSTQLNPLVSFLLTNVLYDYKKFWTRRHFSTPIVDRLFSSELRRLFGTRLKYILCNGAADCLQTKDFFAFMLNVPVIELYGPCEALVSLMSVNDIWDYKRKKINAWQDENEDEEDYLHIKLMPPMVDRNTSTLDSSRNLLSNSAILCPTLGHRIRLENWEDFRTSDHPYPRGRVVVGGEVVSMGYFKQPNQTSNSFYTDSNFITWFRTDDIARVFPNGSFEIISGITEMIKMNDGQFISLSQIEHLLRNSQFVENVCVVCGEDRKFIIALVVPNLRRLALKSTDEANSKMGICLDPEPEELLDYDFRREVCNDRLLCEFVNEHLSKLIAKAGLQSIPKRFHLIPEIWTPDTELVTPAFEPKRNAIQKFYASDIQSIYKTEFSLTRDRLSTRRARSRQDQSQVSNLYRQGQSHLTVDYHL